MGRLFISTTTAATRLLILLVGDGKTRRRTTLQVTGQTTTSTRTGAGRVQRKSSGRVRLLNNSQQSVAAVLNVRTARSGAPTRWSHQHAAWRWQPGCWPSSTTSSGWRSSTTTTISGCNSSSDGLAWSIKPKPTRLAELPAAPALAMFDETLCLECIRQLEWRSRSILRFDGATWSEGSEYVPLTDLEGSVSGGLSCERYPATLHWRCLNWPSLSDGATRRRVIACMNEVHAGLAVMRSQAVYPGYQLCSSGLRLLDRVAPASLAQPFDRSASIERDFGKVAILASFGAIDDLTTG